MATMNPNAKRRLADCMRNLMAQGWTDEALLVDTAAQILGGDEAAQLLAKRVYDQTFKIHPAN